MLFVCCVKNTIIDGGSTALYTAYTVYTVDMVYTVYTVDMAYTVDMIYTVDKGDEGNHYGREWAEA